jgi:hypothetical protein
MPNPISQAKSKLITNGNTVQDSDLDDWEYACWTVF